MSKLNKILIISAIILVVILAVVIYWQKGGFDKPYWAIYARDGNIYFGQISYFPKFSLTNVWILQGAANADAENLNVARFDTSSWGPENRLYLNSDQIIWKTKLRNDSQLLNRFKIFKSATPTSY